MNSPLKRAFFSFAIILVLLGSLTYYALLQTGKKVVEKRTAQVNKMVEHNPRFFQTIFDEILPYALNCEGSTPACTQTTRMMFDTLPVANIPAEVTWELRPSTSQPIYFISLLPSGEIAKLFFSGDLSIEPVDTYGEKLVQELLEGKRQSLYGPYFNQETMDEINYRNPRAFKPGYLRDLYSQVEVIVPYYQSNKVVGAIVYLHGE